jgi:hypothetical protein
LPEQVPRQPALHPVHPVTHYAPQVLVQPVQPV